MYELLGLDKSKCYNINYNFINSSLCRSSNKHFPEMTQSSQSTLHKSVRNKALPIPEEYTTVVFSFCDEQFPYRTKIPGRQITLIKFKEYLPKKGNYRYVIELINKVVKV